MEGLNPMRFLKILLAMGLISSACGRHETGRNADLTPPPELRKKPTNKPDDTKQAVDTITVNKRTDLSWIELGDKIIVRFNPKTAKVLKIIYSDNLALQESSSPFILPFKVMKPGKSYFQASYKMANGDRITLASPEVFEVKRLEGWKTIPDLPSAGDSPFASCQSKAQGQYSKVSEVPKSSQHAIQFCSLEEPSLFSATFPAKLTPANSDSAADLRFTTGESGDFDIKVKRFPRMLLETASSEDDESLGELLEKTRPEGTLHVKLHLMLKL